MGKTTKLSDALRTLNSRAKNPIGRLHFGPVVLGAVIHSQIVQSEYAGQILENLRLCFYGGVDFFFFFLTRTHDKKHSISKVNTLSLPVINDPLLQLTAAEKGFRDPAPPCPTWRPRLSLRGPYFLKYISRIHLAIMKSLKSSN